ncbi:MAG: hypothetical protein A2Y34_03915 [Spirochaetes bacterium GWC1_27_15]|nr:MAG: hypothetical protein A2Y34_03915 [Spirochaetes bacterium GWC1_27_15]
MNKIKQWIKNKLIAFLGIDEIVNLLDKHIDNNDNSFKDLRSLAYSLNNNTRNELKRDVSHCQDSVNVLHNTIENVVHIGTDVRYHNERTHSWAVICIEGNINIVKFVDLGNQDARSILEYLKHFEAGRHCIDTPYKQMFYDDGLFKF